MPFCGAEIVRAYDHSMISDELSDEEREATVCDSCDSTDGQCEHLAFRSDWAYCGSEVVGNWEPEILKLAQAVEDDPDAGPENIAEAMHVQNVDLEPIARRVLPEFDFSSSDVFVEKFDGPQSGGPTYMHIFLRKKVQP